MRNGERERRDERGWREMIERKNTQRIERGKK